MDKKTYDLIHKTAAERPYRPTKGQGSDIGARIVDDFIKGAQRNPRLAHVQVGTNPEGVKTASASLTALDIAKIAGSLQALAEAEFTLKEASEALGLPEETVQFVLNTVK
jgi:hypothetical protein